MLGSATIAGLNAAGEALQDAGYEVHELLMERDGLVSADLERCDGAAEDDDFQEAANIVWEHFQDEAEQAEIRLRNPDDAYRPETISAAELRGPPRRPRVTGVLP